MTIDSAVKTTVYRSFVETGKAPTAEAVAREINANVSDVLDAFRRLHAQHLLVLDDDRQSIRMALPFSAIPTQHVIESGGVRYFANCAWDAFGIVAALQRSGIVHSRCAQSGEPLRLAIGRDGPEPSGWLYHTHVPAAQWWQNIVFT